MPPCSSSCRCGTQSSALLGPLPCPKTQYQPHVSTIGTYLYVSSQSLNILIPTAAIPISPYKPTIVHNISRPDHLRQYWHVLCPTNPHQNIQPLAKPLPLPLGCRLHLPLVHQSSQRLGLHLTLLEGYFHQNLEPASQLSPQLLHICPADKVILNILVIEAACSLACLQLPHHYPLIGRWPDLIIAEQNLL